MSLHALAIHLKDQSKHFLFNNCFFNAQWGHLVIFGRPLGSFEGYFNIDCLVTLYQASYLYSIAPASDLRELFGADVLLVH